MGQTRDIWLVPTSTQLGASGGTPRIGGMIESKTVLANKDDGSTFMTTSSHGVQAICARSFRQIVERRSNIFEEHTGDG